MPTTNGLHLTSYCFDIALQARIMYAHIDLYGCIFWTPLIQAHPHHDPPPPPDAALTGIFSLVSVHGLL